MSTRNGSYARIVDAQRVGNDNKVKQSPEKAPKSPESSRPAFSGKNRYAMEQKAKRVHNHAPSPHQAPRPHGMGEQGVNWRIHSMRMNMMRNKANKAMDKAHSPKQGFNKNKGPERESK